MKKIFAIFAFFITTQAFAQTTPMVSLKVFEGDSLLGEMKIKLYDETPQHRDNFLKLVRAGYYNGTLFHRIIPGFMIQGGDPNSKNAPAGQPLGNGGPGYTIPAEFISTLFHKKGALAAARQGDQVNPKKESSGSQFYIVTGQVYNAPTLKNMESQKGMGAKQAIFNEIIYRPENKPHLDSLMKFQTTGDFNSMNTYIAQHLEPLLNAELKKQGKEPFKFTEEMLQTYSTIGGAPSLDGDYTVFGEIVEGIEVTTRIVNAQRDTNDRPLKDIRMEMKVIE